MMKNDDFLDTMLEVMTSTKPEGTIAYVGVSPDGKVSLGFIRKTKR